MELNHSESAAIIATDIGEFFAPAQYGPLDALLGQHAAMAARISELATLMDSELSGAVPYFCDGNTPRDRYGAHPDAKRLFELKGAMQALHADYWRRALDLTGVRDLMPQELRGKWDDDIREMKTPEFTEEWATATIRDLLDSRERFFMEKVDGVFRGLSPTHLTNRPEGFGPRFILSYAYPEGGSGTSYPNERFRGYMHDLRMVIAKFMGLPDPEWHSTYTLLCSVRRDGKWHPMDGGAIRIRAYMKGTAHLEVHPDMAWRLNRVLAHLYPMAIPSRFREPPKSKPREWAAIERPLPGVIREQLKNCMRVNRHNTDRFVASIPYGIEDKHIRAQLADVLTAIGGQRDRDDFRFDYEPWAALDYLHMVGVMPDEVTHQYYPTPAEMAADLVAELDIGPDDKCLEPSAGRGAIAAQLPADRTTCVELAELNAIILESRGYTVERGDFIAWAAQQARGSRRFDVIAMNPPYSQGRAEAHINAAASLLAEGGRLGAILPASLRGRGLVRGAASHEWSEPMSFDGVSIQVCRYIARISE